MHAHEHGSTRTLIATLAAATLLVPAALSALLPGKTDALVPLAIMLPFVTMGLLDAALHRNHHA